MIQTVGVNELATAHNHISETLANRLKIVENEIAQTHGRTDIEPRLKINSCNFIVAPWWEPNIWEPSVQLALRDLIKPGSIVFDVGANLAGLSILMSRLTGPKGIVCSFEASPRIIELTHGNIIASGCNNIQLYHNAIFSESGKDLMIYAGGHLNDSIFNQGEFQEKVGKTVKTLSLDDFANHMGLIPDLIKMDIEGAEFDALLGMKNKILLSFPHLLLETSPKDMRPFDLLTSLGYLAWDLECYKRIYSATDFPPSTEIRNLLYVHESRVKECPYSINPELKEEFKLCDTDFSLQSSSWNSSWLNFKTGRYIINSDLSGNPEDEVLFGIENEEKEICRYHASRGFLNQHYPDLPFQISSDQKIRIFIKTIKLNSAKHLPPADIQIFRLVNFSTNYALHINYLVA